MNVSRMSFSRNKVVGVKRDVTRKLSDILSPVGTTTNKKMMIGMASNTGSNWTKSKDFRKQPTLTKTKKKLSRKLSESPSGLKSQGPLFKAKMTNAEAHRKKIVKKDNYLRASINHAGQEQVHTRRSSSSKGFSEIRKKLKRGTDEKRKSVNAHDFAYETKRMKDEFRSTTRKKLPRRKYSKSNAVVRLDGESPYMEYLPDRYREYKPKEKKYVRQKSNASLGSVVRQLGQAYSETRSFAGESRSGSRASKRPSRRGSNNKSLLRMGSFKSQKSVSSNRGSVRSGPSRLKKRRQKSQSSNDDSFLQMANLVKQRVLKNKNI